VLLSRMPVDLGMGASHHAPNHPLETPKLSHPPCVVRVDLTRTVPPCTHKAFRSVRRPHSRLILHWRGVGKNSHAAALGPCPTDQWRARKRAGAVWHGGKAVKLSLALPASARDGGGCPAYG
jgi:hypothetical protein